MIKEVASERAKGDTVLSHDRKLPSEHSPNYDETDQRILTELDDYPRRPVALMAERLSMARGTVQARLARIREDGRLRLHSTRIRPESLGYGTRAFVMASVEQNSFERSMTALVDLPEVIECVAVSGPEDIICQVIARDNAHLFEVTQHMMKIEGILRTSTSIVLQEYVELRMAQLLSRDQRRLSRRGSLDGAASLR